MRRGPVVAVTVAAIGLLALAPSSGAAAEPEVMSPAGFIEFKGKLPVADPFQPGDPERFVPLGPPDASRGRVELDPSGPLPQRQAQPQMQELAPSAAQAFSAPNRNFAGIGFTGFRPPDPVGDVGPNHYVQAVNVSFQIFDKDGNAPAGGGGGPFALNSLFAALPGTADLCESTNRGDPIVLYDHLADRWLISQFAFARDAAGNFVPPTNQCIAVSQTPDPRPQAGYNIYSYNVQNTMFADYPHLGVWPDGYYMSTNQFGGTGGGGAYAFDRAGMLAGNAAPIGIYFDTAERNMLPSDLDGATQPAAGSPNFFLKFAGTNQLQVREFHADFATPANSTFGNQTNITTAAFDTTFCGGGNNEAQCIEQPAFTACPAFGCLDALADRVLHRLQYRNYGTFQALLTNHTVDVGSDRAGIRWHELRNTGTGWTQFQEGTHSPGTTQHSWMASIAQNGQRDMALGYSASSATIFPAIRYTGRLAGDGAGQMTQGDNVLQAGGSSQTACQGVDTTTPPDGIFEFCRGRWGDYSAMSVDPVDDCTFWYTQEFMPGPPATAGDWQTRVGAFRFPACEPTLSINNATVNPEGNSGTTPATFTATLSRASGLPVRVDFATENITASAPSDFQAQSGTLTFNPGETTKTITVPVNGDIVDELDETFRVSLSNAREAAISDGEGIGTIIDDDEAKFTIDDVSVTEGDSGTDPATFTASLSNPSDRTVLVDFATADGTATQPADYQQAQGTLEYAPGEQSHSITVQVVGDTAVEPDETFFVRLSNPSNATITDNEGVGTILTDPEPSLSIDDVTIEEQDANADFTVSLSSANNTPVTVDFATADGTATAPADYEATNGSLEFAVGETTKTVSVPVNEDFVDELNETFTVTLSNVVHANLDRDTGTGTGTIVDDDRDGAFTCRAAALRVGSAEAGLANAPNNPCRDETRQTGPLSLGGVTVRLLRGTTDQTPDDLTGTSPQVGDNGSSHAEAGSLVIASGLNLVAIQGLSADAKAECRGGTSPELTGSSRVVALAINGRPIVVATGPVNIPLLLATLRLNQTTISGGQVTQRALVLDNLLAPDVVVAEARAGFVGTDVHPDGSPCTA